jgi:hypothetical protein
MRLGISKRFVRIVATPTWYAWRWSPKKGALGHHPNLRRSWSRCRHRLRCCVRSPSTRPP